MDAHVQDFVPDDNHVLSTMSVHSHSTLPCFRPVEESAELVDGPIGCGEVARGGCLFAWNFSVTVFDYSLRSHRSEAASVV